MIISKSSSILDTIKQFSTELHCMALGCTKIAVICSFRSFSSHMINILKRNLVYMFIMISIISRSTSIFGTIEQISTEECPFDVEKCYLFAVFVHFLRRGCTH